MLAVAQFRRAFFLSTETFIYNYLTALRRVVPVCIGFQKTNLEQFPFEHTLVELYSWSIWNRGWRWLRGGFWKKESYLKEKESYFKYDLPKTFETLERHNVRVLHAHFGFTGSLILPVKHETGLPLVTTFYGSDTSVLPRSEKWLRAYEHLFAEGDLFLVEGPYMRQRLLELGCLPEKANIQRIALPVYRYPFRRRLPKEKTDKVRLLFCGTFREKKGLLSALDAVRYAHERFSNLEFRIIGDGELRSQIEEKIGRHQMTSYTTLLGFQSHQRMIEEMDAADIFIHPSVTAANGDSEGGAPTTILEAQVCGLPVVSTTHADIPSIVVPGESAMLAPERDVATLGDYLCTLLSEPERWAEMGTLGRSFVERYHNVATEIGALEEHYHTLAGIEIV
jgi:colanic acid/amylovoran biosynthesis glycosyltransferase